MAESLHRWESDPLYSAAEVVQDSADRMESVYRMLLHEKSVLKGDPSDSKLQKAVEYHKRDLATALGTTKWQLEDLERALNFSALSDASGLREDAISRHQQFIRAIQEQIIVVEKSLEDSSIEETRKSMHWVDLNEHDRDGFASFLSGANSFEHQPRYDSETSIMKRFLDAASVSGFDEKSDEIVELQSEEIENRNMIGVRHVEQAHYSLNGSNARTEGSNSRHLGFGSSISLQVLAGDKECDIADMGCNTQDLQVDTTRSRLSGSNRRIGILGLPSYIWSLFEAMTDKNFTKRQKDGEVGDTYLLDAEQGSLSSGFHTSQEQNKQTWLWVLSKFNYFRRLHIDGWPNTIETYSCLGNFQGSFQRFQYFVRYNRFRVQLILSISAMLTFLGLLYLFVA